MKSEVRNVREALRRRCFNPCFVTAQEPDLMSQQHISATREAGLAEVGLVRSNLSYTKQHGCLCTVIPTACGGLDLGSGAVTHRPSLARTDVVPVVEV